MKKLDNAIKTLAVFAFVFWILSWGTALEVKVFNTGLTIEFLLLYFTLLTMLVLLSIATKKEEHEK